LTLFCALVVLRWPARALANGAFPDSLSILLPADRPNQIVLATNFGLIVSVDGGQTWTWSCEQTATMGGRLYQAGPPPLDRLFGISTAGLVFSDDGACSWRVGSAPGAGAAAGVSDAFPDPTNPNRVLAIFAPAAAGAPYTVYESADGGATFGTLRFTGAPGDVLTGVEIARSDPRIAYLTVASGDSFSPKLMRTSNGGGDWQATDLAPALGAHNVRLIAIDPGDPNKVFLRVTPTTGDSLAVTDDAGARFVTPVSAPGGILTSFVRLPSGTLLLAGVVGTDNVIFRSADGGMTFSQAPAPALRALATRGGRLFGSADNFDDNPALAFALGESTDEGRSWTPVMTYDQVQAISARLKAACQTDCAAQADRGLWDGTMCDADPMPKPVDGGAADAPADARAGNDGAAGQPGDAPVETGAGGGGGGGAGCRCGVAGPGSPGAPAGAALLALAAALRRASRRSRGRSRSTGPARR